MRGENGYHRTVPDSPRRQHLHSAWWPKLSEKEKAGLGRAFTRAVLNKSVVHPKGRVPKMTSAELRDLIAPSFHYPRSQPQFGQRRIFERDP